MKTNRLSAQKKPKEKISVTPKKQNNTVVRLLGNKLYRQIALVVLSFVLAVILIFATATAWYSNVIFSDGLNFKANQWGFDGKAELAAGIITASPGSSGTIPLTVENPTDEIISVSVGVSKIAMSADIQKRIFFYAYTTTINNGETVNKIYINKLQNQEYTLLSQQTLNLTDELKNNTQLKWEWVYDVLGYYVLGTVTSDTEEIEDYLRPVEYSYDNATFDTDGELVTVDGTKTVIEFLTEITSSDGYAGHIDENTVPQIYTVDAQEKKYYPIEVNGDGYGVWLYLCNRAEIEYSMQIDTELGNQTADPTDDTLVQFRAELTVVGKPRKLQTTVAGTTAEFTQALKDPDCEMIQLSSDVTVTSGFAISAGTEKLIDLGGNTLTSSAKTLTQVKTGGSLAIENGTIQCRNDVNSMAVAAAGGTVNLNNVTISDAYYGIYLCDYLAKGGDSNVYITNCNIESRSVAVAAFANGTDSEQLSRITIENSVLKGASYGFSGNGSDWGTDVLLINCEISGGFAGIYHPQKNSVLKVVDCDVTGVHAGIAVKGGTVTIEGGSVTGTGPDEIPDEGFSSSGFVGRGDAVYIETNYDCEKVVEIKGDCHVTSEVVPAVRMYSPDAENARFVISGGIFSSAVDEKFLAAGCSCNYDPDTKKYVVSNS